MFQAAFIRYLDKQQAAKDITKVAYIFLATLVALHLDPSVSQSVAGQSFELA